MSQDKMPPVHPGEIFWKIFSSPLVLANTVWQNQSMFTLAELMKLYRANEPLPPILPCDWLDILEPRPNCGSISRPIMIWSWPEIN